MASLALAATISGTSGNEWGPTSGHPSWPLPHDCGGHEHLGDLAGTKYRDVLHGGDGCDFLEASKSNDIVYGGNEMDTIYGGKGDDKVEGNKGHDHIYGGSGPNDPSGNDYLDTRDGHNEVGNIEEIHGADCRDRCFLDPDPDGVKFSGCEFLNGKKSPYPVDKFINTSDEGNQKDQRAEVNKFLGK